MRERGDIASEIAPPDPTVRKYGVPGKEASGRRFVDADAAWRVTWRVNHVQPKIVEFESFAPLKQRVRGYLRSMLAKER